MRARLPVLALIAVLMGGCSLNVTPEVVHPTSQTPVADTRTRPLGIVNFTIAGFALGLGHESGDGVLVYHDKTRPFEITGFSAIDVGISSLSATGDVYNLHRLRDFNGTYLAVAAEATLALGAGLAYLRNSNGVIIKVTSTTQGLRFRIAPEGVTITLLRR